MAMVITTALSTVPKDGRYDSAHVSTPIQTPEGPRRGQVLCCYLNTGNGPLLPLHSLVPRPAPPSPPHPTPIQPVLSLPPIFRFPPFSIPNLAPSRPSPPLSHRACPGLGG